MKIIIVLIIIAIYVVVTRNKFNELKNAIKHEGSDIGIQIAKRTACLNDALNIVKLSYEKEIAGIEKLTVNDRLEQLAFLGQKYPELQSINGYQEALRQAMELNKDISAARELLNANIRMYNTAITNFPGNLVASMFGYVEEKYIDEENYEENKKIDKSEVNFDQF